MATRLIIMRHAKSIFLDGLQDDFERPLDKQGQKDAIIIGNQLLSLGWKPDRIMVSPSIRTMETLNRMGEDFTKAKCFPNDELYLADLYTLQHCVNKAPLEATTLLLGHNPAKAGLSTPVRVLSIIFDITKSTPVFPAESETSAFKSI